MGSLISGLMVGVAIVIILPLITYWIAKSKGKKHA